MKEKTKVAIACQGGGSHTAFTAGVLKSFCKNGVFEMYDVVSFSGTSGGAICAALAWYSLIEANVKHKNEMVDRLESFWIHNSTQNLLNRCILNRTLINCLRLSEMEGAVQFKMSPNSCVTHMIQELCKRMVPGFYDFESLLKDFIKDSNIKKYKKNDSPALLVSSVDVKTGNLVLFNSLNGGINVNSLLASAAIPSVFETVHIKNQYFWDGLYSENPPIVPLTDIDCVCKERVPDEIWVIQINPPHKHQLPDDMGDIIDRENEMIGNISLNQGIEQIIQRNEMLDLNAFSSTYITSHNLKETCVYVITMSDKFLENLDYPSKLDRSYPFIKELMDDGEKRGTDFVDTKGLFLYSGRTNQICPPAPQSNPAENNEESEMIADEG
jgi:NTE family protein